MAIDGCKRIYAVSAEDEIKRIRSKECMNKDKDYPKFMKYTAKIPTTKNGKEREYDDIKADRRRVEKRIDPDIVCPMNWMQERLDKIQGLNSSNGIDIFSLMAEKPKKAKASNRQMNKIRKIVEDYDAFTKYILTNNNYEDEDDVRNNEGMSLLSNKSEEVYEAVSKMKINFITMHRLIEVSLEYDGHIIPRKRYDKATKYTTKTLNVLYRANRELFLSCFKENS